MKSLQIVLTLIFVLTFLTTTYSEWTFKESTDPLTDQKISTAILSNDDEKSIVLRCTGNKFEIYFEFGKFLSNSKVPVKYRIDKNDMVEESWYPSAKGTSVFSSESAELARNMISGKTFIIEVNDFRGQPYRSTFDISKCSEIVTKTLSNCGLKTINIRKSIDGLREEIARNIEKWGPKNISMGKRILTELKFYSGPINNEIEPDFAIAIQTFYDDYIKKCKDGEINGAMCKSLKLLSNHDKSKLIIPVTAALYELAPQSLKKEAGSLRIGD